MAFRLKQRLGEDGERGKEEPGKNRRAEGGQWEWEWGGEGEDEGGSTVPAPEMERGKGLKIWRGHEVKERGRLGLCFWWLSASIKTNIGG